MMLLTKNKGKQRKQAGVFVNANTSEQTEMNFPLRRMHSHGQFAAQNAPACMFFVTLLSFISFFFLFCANP
jgi:hypothetical protein